MVTTKKAIIVGATSGIGKALAQLYSDSGYEVGITGRRTDQLDSLAAELPTKAYLCTMDVRDTKNAMVCMKQLIEKMQSVDLIIISAGTGHLNFDLEWNKEKETIETNVSGFAALANVAAQYFIEKECGHLVGISSIASIRGSPVAPSYNASKAFVSSYLEGLRINISKRKLPIAITTIEPGFVDTAMAKSDNLFWVAPPLKAALQISKAIIRKRKKAYITKRWTLIAWLFKLLPEFMYRRI
tara:strand:- start:202 stop:927 length:726 start_codon:yes stop_codon:yes gene_type:complete